MAATSSGLSSSPIGEWSWDWEEKEEEENDANEANQAGRHGDRGVNHHRPDAREQRFALLRSRSLASKHQVREDVSPLGSLSLSLSLSCARLRVIMPQFLLQSSISTFHLIIFDKCNMFVSIPPRCIHSLRHTWSSYGHCMRMMITTNSPPTLTGSHGCGMPYNPFWMTRPPS